MTLRRKAFIFITIICLVLISSVYFISRTIILNNFEQLEQENTEKNLSRAESAIESKISALDTFAQDYAGWDDTYQFIHDGNKAYIESNLVDETFASTKINMMVYTNEDDEVIFSKMFDLDLAQALPLTNDFKKFITPQATLLQHTNLQDVKKGIIVLQKSPMLVVSRPIITSEKKGPIRGSLIMGKYLSPDEINDIRSNTKLNLEILKVGEQKISFTNKEYIHPVTEDLIIGYKEINDINGDPALIIQVNSPRSIYQQGVKASYYLVGSLIAMSLLVTLIAMLYFDKLILKPLKRLVKDVNTIRTNADFSIQVYEGGGSELSLLAHDINKMTAALASGEKALRVVNKEIEFEKQNIEKIVDERTQELKAEQARFIASINSVVEAFILLDTNKQVIITNHVVSHIFNTDHQEWNYDKIQFSLKDSFNFELAYDQSLKQKKSITYDEVQYNDKILKIFFAPVFLTAKLENLVGIVVTIDDITEAKKLERSKDEFFSIASHELRTPLTAIKGNTQMMQKYFAEKINDKDFTSMLNDLYASSVRLIEIVNIFLTTSRLEQGKIEFDIQKFNINELLEEIVRRMRTTAEAKGLDLSFKKPKAEILVTADRNRTEEVIMNLISNAINYTESGYVKLSVRTEDSQAVVSVEDSGKGIAAKDQPLLFRKFQQLNDTLYTRDISRGTGLGLYISRLMIEAMKGKIYIERSEVYKGSVFTFTLPLNAPLSNKNV